MTLQFLIDLMGSERIALGSDYPFPLGEQHPGSMIRSMKLPIETEEDLLYRSALRWLGMTTENLQ